MAGAETEVCQGVQVIKDLGDGMMLCQAQIDSLREQDINARILPTSEHNTMVNNIRKRKHLESVPYCVLNEGKAEIVSGHHRIRAAYEAGIREIVILLDTSGLTRSEIISKQLAHNRLSGFDDQDTLKQMFSMMDNPDDMLASGLSNDLMELPPVTLEPGITPNMATEWKVLNLTFLPHQYDNFEKLVSELPPSDMVGAAGVDIFQKFLDATLKYSRLKDVRNVGMVLALLYEIAVLESARIEEEIVQAEIEERTVDVAALAESIVQAAAENGGFDDFDISSLETVEANSEGDC